METFLADNGLAGGILAGVFTLAMYALRHCAKPVACQWIKSEKVRNVASAAQTKALQAVCGELVASRRNAFTENGSR